LTPDALAADLAMLDAYRGPCWRLPEIRLVRSHLGPRPGYETVGVASLAGR
jgi:hypothetical protein